MTLEYSPYISTRRTRTKPAAPHDITKGAGGAKGTDYKQIEITIRKNGVIRIELIPKHLLNKKKK
jgi:hypothetical protein